jgi:hypothetical protein
MIKSEIGVNAGIIWQYLDNKGECSIDSLKELLNMNERDFFLALGWLARENKLVFYNREKTDFVFLNI